MIASLSGALGVARRPRNMPDFLAWAEAYWQRKNVEFVR